MSTSGGYHEYIGEYHEYIGRCSVHREMFSTSEGYHEYIGGYHDTSGGVQYIGGIP